MNMQAWVVEAFKAPLILKEIASPQLTTETDVLVRTQAISLNPVDWKVQYGFFPLPMPFPLILGCDLVGEVMAVGSAVKSFQVGDRVLAYLPIWERPGCFSEKVLVDQSHLVFVPEKMKVKEIAGLPLAGLSALQALKTLNVSGKRILIHASAGGVGHLAIQIAKIMGAKEIIATASIHNHAWVKTLGADRVLDRHHWQAEFQGEICDAIFDTVGEPVTTHSLDYLRKGGHLVSIVSGLSPELKKTAENHGILFDFLIVETDAQALTQLLQWMQVGRLSVEVSEVFTFDQLSTALEKHKQGSTTGKIIVMR